MTAALERGELSAARPGRTLPPGKTRFPLYRRLGGPQSRSGQLRKISSPPGFDLRTVQPVVNRYTDWATYSHVYCRIQWKINRITLSAYMFWPNIFLSNLWYLYSWMWQHVWPKHVGICVYNVNWIHLCAFVTTVIVCVVNGYSTQVPLSTYFLLNTQNTFH